ncbi:hypothetical protein [Trichlorobacter sp.]|uniref:hypothetical protein n=1 Tax=Trichlorobacter sp. TaxID=2911007 RepID=UPI002A36F0B1|nr:hypothetical protein [Trichlorobacter sp.]MDY0385088.1 hypothetical protein [Trichlorobacter sp.]
MQLNAYEISLISGCFTILGTLVGTWTGYRLTLALSLKTAFREASIKFRTAFRDELLALNPAMSANTIDACDLLTAAFEKHRAAIFEFKPFLDTKAEKLELAWQEYYRVPDEPNFTIPFLTQYSGHGCSTSEARQRRILAASRIEKILSFAYHH